jgi:hypothetical protein
MNFRSILLLLFFLLSSTPLFSWNLFEARAKHGSSWNLFEAKKDDSSSSQKENLYKGDYQKLDISGPIDVVLRDSKECRIEVDVPKSLQKKVRVTIEGQVAKVRFDEDFFFQTSKSKNRPVRIIAYAPEFRQIVLGSAASLTTETKIKQKELYLFKRGSGSIELDVEVETLRLNLRGSSLVVVKGAAELLRLSSVGTISFEGRDLETDRAEISARGSSKILVHVKKSLKVSLSGNAKLRYLGNPELEQEKTHGASSIKPL